MNKDDKNFDGLDISKISQGLIGVTADVGKNKEGEHNFEVDLDDSEGMLSENFTEIFQQAIKNIITNASDQIKSFQNQEDTKNSRDIFIDLPLASEKAEKGGYIPLEYKRFIYCSQCQHKDVLTARDCLKCDGAGTVMAHRRVEIKIPRNVLDGTVLQITNEGHAPGGDLFVKVIIREEF